jgi:translation initiation factor 3 subunit C
VHEDGTLNTIDIEKSIIPSFINFLQKLDSELLKAFQNVGHTKFEYLQRIRDESKLLFLCDDVQAFVNLYYPGENSNISRIALLKLDHLYYKNDTLYTQFKANNSTTEPTYIPNKDSRVLIEELVRIVNNQSSSKMKVRAALMQAYHHGLHRRFYEGKELLLKTHVGESIHL